MKTVELLGHVDEQHRLSVDVPPEVPPGPIRLSIVLPSSNEPPEEDAAGSRWASIVAREWSDELNDPREDIYTLSDGDPARLRALLRM
jgi:hypothetical protein